MGGGRLREVVAHGGSTVSCVYCKPILLSSLGLRNGNVIHAQL